MERQEESVSAGNRRLSDRLLRRIFVWLILFQFLAGPVVFLRPVLPPVVGFGSFSTSVNFQYLIAALAGAFYSLMLLLPTMFALAPWSMARRLLIAFALGLSFSFIFFLPLLAFLGVPRGWAFSDVIQEFFLVSGYAIYFLIGIAILPLALRAWRGVYMTRESETKIVTRKENLIEWIVAIGLVVLVTIETPVFNSFSVGSNHIGLLGVAGAAVGSVTLLLVLLLFRDMNTSSSYAALAVYVSLAILFPATCIWVADYSTLTVLPAGSGQIYLAFLSGAVLLLIHTLVLRARGYRIQKHPIESRVQQLESTMTVDPFSD